jgi:sialate O-acetylesterase
MRRIALIVLMASSGMSAARAQPATLLETLFRDHAVLQRDRPIAVWGHAAAHEKVTVSLANSTASAEADAAGVWRATLPAMPAGGPFVLTARAASGAVMSASDVLLGDVFLCSGQSNMELSVLRAGDTNTELGNSSHPTIRMITVAHDANPAPLASWREPASWQIAAPETIASWSAACYFFARELQQTLNVPLGLIHASWGGSNIRPWISAEGIRSVGGYDTALDILAVYARDRGAAQQAFAARWEQWWREKSGDRPGAEPWSPSASSGNWRPAPEGLGDWRSWGVPELKNFAGVVWFRVPIKLTAAQAQGGATLSLGLINQVDQTWINGKAVGNTFGYNAERTYQLSKGMLHAGENLLVINTLSNYGVGGLLAGGNPRALHLSTGETIPLTAGWQYRIVPSSFGYPPRAPWESVGGMTTLYNAMIAPLDHIALRGVLWYQGESNTDEAGSYQGLLTALMADWRRRFGADLPFLIVQLPNYGPQPTMPAESGWASLREAQRKVVASDPHAGLAVTIDIGDAHNLHPTNKQDVGRRLARGARHVIYGESIAPSGPVARRVSRRDGQIVVDFADVDGALVAYSHDEPIGFELCAKADGTCRYVESRIEGASVILSTPSGMSPTRVRYCWADSPVCTLFDRAGLPAGPFEAGIQP